MKVGIISDTHDRQDDVAKAAAIFSEQKVGYILHAGDMVSASTAKAFAQVNGAKFIGVFGNCDREKSMLTSYINDFGGEIHGHVYRGEIGGRRVFMTHKPSTLGEVSQGDNFDLVVYGHTHKQFIRKVGETLVINPGTSAVVVLKLDDMSVAKIPLE
ncbi:MAG: metallophosphoesterase [Planctomycetota bacterium]|jgi:putative phosphoesterase